ncbi:MAG: PKD domain-containing protein [Chitinophagales bacterium]|nr:PKD domain-containing protein [Chitinophagales bacterium]
MLLLPGVCMAQSIPGLQWQQCHSAYQARAATVATAQSFVVVLQPNDTALAPHLLLAAFDQLGTQLWEQTLFSPSGTRPKAHSITSFSNGFLISGSIDSAGHQYRVLWCTNSSGQLLWSYKEFFDDSLEVLYGKAIGTKAGQIAWLTERHGPSLRDLQLSLLSATGTLLSTQIFGGSDNEYAADVVEKSGSGFFLLATTNSADLQNAPKNDSTDVLLINLDADGNKIWQRCYGGTNFDYASKIVPWGKKYLLAGASRSSVGVNGHHGSNDYYDVWLALLDTAGNLLWNNSYGGKQDEFPSGIHIVSKNAAVIGATAYSANAHVGDHIGATWFSDCWTFQVDSLGKFKWGKSIGGTSDDFSVSFFGLDSLRYVHVGGSLSRYGDLSSSCASAHPVPSAGAWIAMLNASCSSFVQAFFTPQSDELTVSFTNNSKHATSYHWSFGDGSTSTQSSPQQVYASPGTYEVCLIASNFCSSDTLCQYVTVCTPPQATADFVVTDTGVQFYDLSPFSQNRWWDFGDGYTAVDSAPLHTYLLADDYWVTLIVANACGETDTTQFLVELCAYTAPFINHVTNGLSVQFSAYTFFSPQSWHWDFGDGNVSNHPTPQHIYMQQGEYTVCVTVFYDSCDAIISCQEISVCQPPQAAFAANTNELEIEFSDLSAHTSSWLWHFGDGNSSTAQNPTHIYTAPGTYQVCLIAVNNCAADTFCQSLTVTCTAPQAQFTATPNELQVAFSDLSLYADGWLWDFGDSNSSTAQNPTYIYTAPGTYQVCLIAVNNCAADTFCTLIEVSCQIPESNFSTEIVELTVIFTQTASLASEWFWDFGDGTVSTQPDPTHTYALPGTYTVCLVVKNTCGSDTFCTTLNLSCPPPAAVFDTATNFLTVHLINLSSATEILWLLGDGTTSTEHNLTHTYTSAGEYQICLITQSVCGNDTACIMVSVQCPPLEAGFSYVIVSDTVFFTSLSPTATSWFWNFGDGSTSTEANPTHVFAQGIYQICLTVSDGCSQANVCDTLVIVADGLSLQQRPYLGPNPTKNFVWFSLSEPALHVVIGSPGSVVSSVMRPMASAFRLDLSGLPAGVYLIQITTPTTLHVFPIMKQ